MSETINAETGEIINDNAFFNTIDTSTVVGKLNVLNAKNNAKSLKDIGDKEIVIVGAFTCAGVRKGRNGQPDTPCTSTYLLERSGIAFFSQSDGIARSARDIYEMFPDFNAPDGGLKIKVATTKLDNGNTIKSLVVGV